MQLNFVPFQFGTLEGFVPLEVSSREVSSTYMFIVYMFIHGGTNSKL